MRDVVCFGFNCWLLFTTAAIHVAISTARAGEVESKQKLGTIEGVITFSGVVPKSDAIDESGAHRSLLEVDGKTRGLKDVAVYLTGIKTEKNVAEARNQKGKQDAIVIDQMNHTFIPHLVVVRPGEEVRFSNSDPANHNVRSLARERTNAFNVFTGQGAEYKHRFVVETNYRPIQIVCDIHPWMIAWVYVLDHPYFAVTDRQGNFRISDVPAGTFELRIEQPDIRYAQKKTVSVSPGEVTRIQIEAQQLSRSSAP